MPEGPEIKTITIELNDKIVDKEIADVVFSANAQNITFPIPTADFAKKLKGRAVKKVNRIGKYIDIAFDESIHMVLHLLITGRLSFYAKNNKELPKYFTAGFIFTDGTRLCLGDKRGWTKLKLMTNEDIQGHKNFSDLGIDVFSDQYTPENFSKAINLKKPIYSVLMDQKIISGLGNIYVNEILFQAKIHPTTPASLLNQNHIQNLFEISKQVLQKAFAEKGTTVKSFVERTASSVGWHTLDGSEGTYYKYLKVFDKSGQKCTVCANLIQKTTLGGRNAFYCPNCQV